MSELAPETVHDAAGLLGEAITVPAEAEADISPSPEELIGMIDNVLQIAQSLELTYSRHPGLVSLPPLVYKLRQNVAPGLDRQLKSETGISWLHVQKAARTM